MRLVVWFSALALASGCQTYSRRQSVLTPVLAPPMWSGQPIQGQGELSLGSGKVVSAGAPTESESGNAGVWTPIVDVNGAARLRIAQDWDVGFVFDGGPENGAQSVVDDQPRPEGSVWGGGPSLRFSRQLSPEIHLAIGADLLLYSVPWIEYDTCATNCGGAKWSIVSRDSRSATVLSLSVLPSWHKDRVTVFAGLTMRNQPQTPLGSVTVLPGTGGVENGPMYLLASAGVEVELGGRVKALAMVYQPLMSDPVSYLPTLGLSLSFGFGDAPAAR